MKIQKQKATEIKRTPSKQKKKNCGCTKNKKRSRLQP